MGFSNSVQIIFTAFFTACTSNHVLDKSLLFFSVVFPQDLLENGLAAKNFAMLGLGDIVIPGIFIALLLRFDYRFVQN